MTIELLCYISFVVFIINILTLGVFGKLNHEQRRMTARLWSRIDYLEMVTVHHGLVPLPWEEENLDEARAKTKKFKREGNVVHLRRE